MAQLTRQQWTGTPASPGRAGGHVVRAAAQVPEPPRGPAPPDLAAEAARIEPAAAVVGGRLNARAGRATGSAREVLEATALMAEDPTLISAARALVDDGLPAPRAVWEAANAVAETFEALGDYFAERVRDVHDVRDRLVAELLGLPEPGLDALDAPAVLVARDLAPADTAGLDPAMVLALVTEEGGPTSHTAILARSLGIPAVVGCAGVLSLTDGDPVLVDGAQGTVALVDSAVATAARAPAPASALTAPGATADGARVALLANVGDAATAAAAAARGAEGVGLFRTELGFLGATVEPAVAAQSELYASVLGAFAGKPVTARTLDAGADKPLPFLSLPAEPNPALGVRGLRSQRARVDGLDRQLAALVSAAESSGARLKVMAPMVSTAEEAAWFAARARSHGVTEVGVMIEVPAAVLTAAEVCAEVDFVSVGTNDLSQYLFAADRQSGPLGALQDPWQPALLRLLDLLCRSAGSTPVGLCGEAAADPSLAPVLVGLGVASLSMGAASLGAVSAALGAVDLERCRRRAAAALAAPDPAAARAAAS